MLVEGIWPEDLKGSKSKVGGPERKRKTGQNFLEKREGSFRLSKDAQRNALVTPACELAAGPGGGDASSTERRRSGNEKNCAPSTRAVFKTTGLAGGGINKLLEKRGRNGKGE